MDSCCHSTKKGVLEHSNCTWWERLFTKNESDDSSYQSVSKVFNCRLIYMSKVLISLHNTRFMTGQINRRYSIKFWKCFFFLTSSKWNCTEYVWPPVEKYRAKLAVFENTETRPISLCKCLLYNVVMKECFYKLGKQDCRRKVSWRHQHTDCLVLWPFVTQWLQ